MAHIPLEDCIHGQLYRLQSRNLTLGVYNMDTGGFIGVREKFGDRYLFTEFHWDIAHGTARPLEDLGTYQGGVLSEGESRDGRWHMNQELFNWLEAKGEEYTDPAA